MLLPCWAVLRSGVAGRDFRGGVRAQRQVEAAGGLHLDRSHRRLGPPRSWADLGTQEIFNSVFFFNGDFNSYVSSTHSYWKSPFLMGKIWGFWEERLNMTIEIVDFPMNSMVMFNSYVKLPEGIWVGIFWGVGPDLRFSGGIWAVPGQTLSGNKSG